MKYIKVILLAVSIALVLIVLSVVPPVSELYNWLDINNLNVIWYGIVAGIIAVLLMLYNDYAKKQ